MLSIHLNTAYTNTTQSEGSISSAFQTPQTTRQLDHKVRHLQRNLTKKRQLSSSLVSHLQHLEKSAQTAMNMNLLLHQGIKVLWQRISGR